MPLTRDSGTWMLKRNLWSGVGNRLQKPQDVHVQLALNTAHLYLLEFGNILHSAPPKMGKDCCVNRVFLVKHPSFAFSTPSRATQKVMMPPQWQNTFLTKGQKQPCFNVYRSQFHWPAATCLTPVQCKCLNVSKYICYSLLQINKNGFHQKDRFLPHRDVLFLYICFNTTWSLWKEDAKPGIADFCPTCKQATLQGTAEETDVILARGSDWKTMTPAADALRHSWTDVLRKGRILISLVSFFCPVLSSKG